MFGSRDLVARDQAIGLQPPASFLGCFFSLAIDKYHVNLTKAGKQLLDLRLDEILVLLVFHGPSGESAQETETGTVIIIGAAGSSTSWHE